MATLKRQRDALLLNLKASTTPKNIPSTSDIPSFSELMKIIENAYQSGRHYAIFNARGLVPSPKKIKLLKQSEINSDVIKQNIIFISDFHKSNDENTYKVLIKRGDPDIANPSFTNIQKNTSRSIEPERDETVGNSSHFIISTHDDHSSFDGCRAALERTTGLPRGVILPYLNGLIAENCKNDPKFSYKNSNGDDTRYRPAIMHTSHPSASLKKDLENGYVSSVELVDRKAHGLAGMDDDKNLKHVSRKLHFHMKPLKEIDKVKNLLKKLSNYAAAEKYDYLKVSIRDVSQDKYASSRFEVDQSDAIDKLYSRAETITTGFSQDMVSCYDNFHKELVNGLITLINDDTKW